MGPNYFLLVETALGWTVKMQNSNRAERARFGREINQNWGLHDKNVRTHGCGGLALVEVEKVD